jgi:hypothetical protein
MIGKSRKRQPWEVLRRVRYITPVPSPTVTYGVLKHFNDLQVKEWKWKHMFFFLANGSKWTLILRILMLPFKLHQFRKSLVFAKDLISIGARYE